MSARVKIDGVGRVLDRLRNARVDEATPGAAVEYQAPYAVYVHENLTARHPNGQAKFLEQPARQMRAQLLAMVRRRVAKDRNLEAGVNEAAHALLDASQQLVPVLTGKLKRSGRVRTTRTGRFA